MYESYYRQVRCIVLLLTSPDAGDGTSCTLYDVGLHFDIVTILFHCVSRINMSLECVWSVVLFQFESLFI